MRGTKNWRLLSAVMVMCLLLIFSGCSRKMPQPVVIAPPMSLMDPCQEPQNSYTILDLIDSGNKTEAKIAFVHYVLDVRDGFEVCNGRLLHIKDYVSTMQEAFDADR